VHSVVPADAFLAVTVRDGAERVRALRESAVLKAFLDGEAYRTLARQPGFLQAQGGLFLFAGTVGMEPWTLAAQALGKELVLAVGPRAGSEKPYVLVVIKPAEEAAANAIFDRALAMAGAVVDEEPVESRSKLTAGVRGYELSKEAYVARFDGLMLFCNDAEVLARVIEQRDERTGKLAGDAAFLKSRDAAPAGAAVWAHASIKAMRAATGERFDAKLDNPLAAMLLGGWVQAARAADAAVVWAVAETSGVSLEGRLIGGDIAEAEGEKLDPFFVSAGDPLDWQRLELPGLIGRISLSRDWAGLWEAREGMMDAEALRGLLNFASTLTTLMGNLDYSSELLPGLRPTVHLLAARQKFAGPPPTPELPGFALLLHLKDAAKLAPKLENAALMTMSFINVDRGQKMQPQYNIGLDMHGKQRMVTAAFPEDVEPGPRGVRYNLEPAVSVVGDRLLICTSRKMAEDVIDALAKLPEAAGAAAESAGAAPESAADVVRVDLAALREAFEVNREVFIANRMLEADLERAAAVEQVDAFLQAAKLLSDFELKLQRDKDGLSIRARLELNAKVLK
jgi:hypothetical protein